jgi:exopolysaccharide biosynthesis protein
MRIQPSPKPAVVPTSAPAPASDATALMKPAPSALDEHIAKHRLLKPGSHGEPVRELQTLLSAAGHSVELNGRYGPKTQAAVAAVQEQFGIEGSGTCGPRTLAALRSSDTRGPASAATVDASRTQASAAEQQQKLRVGVAAPSTVGRPGIVRETLTVQEVGGAKHKMHVVTVDLRAANAKLISTSQTQVGLTTTQFAKKAGASIAINGDLFDGGRARGVAIGPDGNSLKGAQNRDLPRFTLFKDGSFAVQPEGTAVPQDGSVVGAVSGKQGMLVRDGRANLNTVKPNLERAQMSAVGQKADGSVVFVTVGGREGKGSGVNRNELANELAKLGVVNAIELDGGGSSSLVVDGKNLMPGGDKGGVERHVANHIGVVLQ